MKIPAQFSHPVKIGSGSFSTVMRVFQRKLQRHVVLKIITATGSKEAAAVAHEARFLASTRPPCAPHVYDIIQSGKKTLILMEWVRGIALSDLIQKSPPNAVALTIASNIVAALAQLHASNIAHRDLKPENIMITGGGVCFVDFGFSCSLRAHAAAPAVMQGTPGYMAPELWSCRETIDYKKADLFALGTILHNLLGGSLPSLASALTEIDPALRPADCVAFDAAWRAQALNVADAETLRRFVQPNVSRHVGCLLTAAVRQLCAESRSEEAYALLIESLDEWPDNSEALDILQTSFSSPGRKPKSKLPLIYAAACLGITALVAAYMLGARSPRSVDGVDIMAKLMENQRLDEALLSMSRSQDRRPGAAAKLRITAPGTDLTGRLVVVNPGRTGALRINGLPLTRDTGSEASTRLSAGAHRVEWFDSTMHRSFGETVELLPFETKTISLARFFNGK